MKPWRLAAVLKSQCGKGPRSLEKGLSGFDEQMMGGNKDEIPDADTMRSYLSKPTPQRILYVAQAMRNGMSIDDIFTITKYDPWFLGRIKHIVDTEDAIKKGGLPTAAKAG